MYRTITRGSCQNANSDFIDLGWDLKICISYTLAGHTDTTDTTGLWITPNEQQEFKVS